MTTKKLLIDPLKEMLDLRLAIENGCRAGGPKFRFQIIQDMGGYQLARSGIAAPADKMMEETA